MSRVLIIRSVSFQQLDQNLPRIAAAFPQAELYLLTHGHGLSSAAKYAGLAGTVEYDSPRNFSPWHRPATLKRMRFDEVVVPVSNLGGAGFLNVFLLALRVPARRRWMCNLVSELRPLPVHTVLGKALLSALCWPPALLGTLLLLPFTLGLLFWHLLVRGKRRPESGKAG